MKRRNLVALFAAGALALAACGGDDDDAADDPVDEVDDDAADDADDADDMDDADDADDMDDADDADDMDDADDADDMDDSDDMVPADWPDELVFTLTPSQEAGGLIETAAPLAAMLEERLGVAVESLVPTDYAGVIVALQSGQAHIAGGLGPAQMVQAEDQAGAALILQSVRFGYGQYVTQWFTNNPDDFCADEPVANDDGWLFCNGVDQASDPAEGPIGDDQLPNVAGKSVSFVDQGSTSGYLVPALGLINAGVDPLDDIETIFAGGHDNSVQAVYDGTAEVGVSFNDARGTIAETVPDVGEVVVVFGWSAPIPNDGFAVNGDLPADLQEAIAEAFLDIAATEEGAALLDELYEINEFVRVPEGSYDIIRNLETELSELLS